MVILDSGLSIYLLETYLIRRFLLSTNKSNFHLCFQNRTKQTQRQVKTLAVSMHINSTCLSEMNEIRDMALEKNDNVRYQTNIKKFIEFDTAYLC